jgi:hypothetical protein
LKVHKNEFLGKEKHERMRGGQDVIMAGGVTASLPTDRAHPKNLAEEGGIAE